MILVGIIVSIYVTLIGGLIGLGWYHQACKTEQEQHLDFLVDAGDDYATEYAIKTWGECHCTLGVDDKLYFTV